MGRIAKDEERHEEFFSNLVAHCLTTKREETVAAIAARAAELQAVGGDIDAYQDKVAHVAEVGIFDADALRAAKADRITAWGLADEPALREFVTQ
jgi:acyl-[acyl-carrier-protein] desaturase